MSFPDYPFSGEHHVVDGGHRLHYVDEGQGEPVVMVHGNPSWSYLWRHLITALAPTHRAIAPDHIGCGLSDKPDAAHYPYRLERRVEDFGSLLDALGVTRDVTLVLHDWGGMIGMAWAVRHPERVKRIVVMNTAAFTMPADKKFPLALRVARDSELGTFLVRRLNAFSLAWALVGMKEQRMERSARAAYLAPYRSFADRVAILRFVQDIPLAPGDPSYDLVREVEAGLSRFATTPMLILWGERDFVFDDPFLAGWLRRFPQARAHLYPRAGHLVMEDRKDEVIDLVRRFVAAEST